MKILSVIESLGHGGAETVLVDLVQGLTRHDHAVLHFSAANGIAADRRFVQTLERSAVPCVDAHWRSVESAAGVRAALGRFVPDVVLLHWWGGEPWSSWIDGCRADASRPTFVLVMHHDGPRPRCCYDHHVLVAERQRPHVADRPAGAVRVIPNGIDLGRFGGRRRASAAGTMVVGRVSSLRPGKIPEDWIRTAVAYGLPRTRFVIAGDGSVRPKLVGDVRTLGLERRFALPGYVPRRDVPALLETFDVFCYVTSTAVECHPLALLEALAAGVPVVAESRGGIPEIVRHGVNGLLARSVDEVGAHLHALRRDPALRWRLGAGARLSADRFAGPRQLAAYEALLADIAGSRRPLAA